MRRYLAPADTSAIFTPHSGELRVRGGHIQLADDAPDCDHNSLMAAGCKLAPAEPEVDIKVNDPAAPDKNSAAKPKARKA